MIIEVDFVDNAGAVVLAQPQDCQGFHVAVRGGDRASLGAVLIESGVGRLLPSGEAMIDPAAVRRLAAGRVASGWEGDFACMLRYAASKGWVEEGSGAIQAHLEWSEPEGAS